MKQKEAFLNCKYFHSQTFLRCCGLFSIWQKGIIAWIHRKWNLFMPSFPLSACLQTFPRNVLTFSNMNISEADWSTGDWMVCGHGHFPLRLWCLRSRFEYGTCWSMEPSFTEVFRCLSICSTYSAKFVGPFCRSHLQISTLSVSLDPHWASVEYAFFYSKHTWRLTHLLSFCELFITDFQTIWNFSRVSLNSWNFVLLIDSTPLRARAIANIGQTVHNCTVSKFHSQIQSGSKFPTCALLENYCCRFLVVQHLLRNNASLQHFPWNKIWQKSLARVRLG